MKAKVQEDTENHKKLKNKKAYKIHRTKAN